METVVLIPAYKPDEALIRLVDQLYAQGLGILVVNDGSSAYYEPVFHAIARKAVVLSLPDNCGKGGALKHGMAHLRQIFPACRHFITADADGQHQVRDILRVRDELRHGARFVLTVRALHRDIPLRSRFGNALSRVIYTLLTGHYFQDNQSGLRGFSVEQIGWLLKVGGEKYDYEMNMLYYADKQAIPITTLTIDAIYIDGNKSSHFDPVLDTLRIYRRLFSSAWATFASIWIIQCILFMDMAIYQFLPLVRFREGMQHLLVILPTAGAAGVAFEVVMNKFVVFRRVRYADTLRTIMYTLMRFIAYTLGCAWLCYYQRWPIFPAFNVTAILLLPAEYFLHKLIRKAGYRDINKEGKDR